jgi:hypothetical protein
MVYLKFWHKPAFDEALPGWYTTHWDLSMWYGVKLAWPHQLLFQS